MSSLSEFREQAGAETGRESVGVGSACSAGTSGGGDSSVGVTMIVGTLPNFHSFEGQLCIVDDSKEEEESDSRLLSNTL